MNVNETTLSEDAIAKQIYAITRRALRLRTQHL
jgi:hypothetical protein